MDFEEIIKVLIIPIIVGVVINRISDKKEKSHRKTVGSRNGGFTFTLTIKLKKR